MIFAVPDQGHSYLTQWKVYRVIDDRPHGFSVTDDDGILIDCAWDGKSHGATWTRISIHEILQRHGAAPDCIAEVTHALHQIMGEVK